MTHDAIRANNVVMVKGVRHLAKINIAYPDGYSVRIPCLQGTWWIERHQLQPRNPEDGCCWKCKKKMKETP